MNASRNSKGKGLLINMLFWLIVRKSKRICGFLPHPTYSTHQRISDQVRKRSGQTQGSTGMPSREWRLRLYPEDFGERYGSLSGIFGHKTHHFGTYRKHPQHFYD